MSLASQLPRGLVAVEATIDVDPGGLLPGERELVHSASAARQREFATGRYCARTALGQLGFPAAPILRDKRRCPVWPPGVIGSITHCHGYRAAAVGRQSDYQSVGIDAEVHARLPGGVLETIASPTEQDQLLDLEASHPGWHWDRILFSAKESIYKSWYPLDPRWHDFFDAEVQFDPATGRFRAVFGRDWTWPPLRGTFAVVGDLITTVSLVSTPEVVGTAESVGSWVPVRAEIGWPAATAWLGA